MRNGSLEDVIRNQLADTNGGGQTGLRVFDAWKPETKLHFFSDSEYE